MKAHREYVAEQEKKSPAFAAALSNAQAEARLAVLLARMRERRGWTQRQLADVAGIRQPQIARIESGTYFPSLDTLWKLADALNATVRIGPGREISIAARRMVSDRR
jgi:transcriptional regulator with XRE-family HTH domain